MCTFNPHIHADIIDDLMATREPFDAQDVLLCLRAMEQTAFYREVLHETLTYMQRNSDRTGYVARTKSVVDDDGQPQKVWEWVYMPEAYNNRKPKPGVMQQLYKWLWG